MSGLLTDSLHRQMLERQECESEMWRKVPVGIRNIVMAWTEIDRWVRISSVKDVLGEIEMPDIESAISTRRVFVKAPRLGTRPPFYIDVIPPDPERGEELWGYQIGIPTVRVGGGPGEAFRAGVDAWLKLWEEAERAYGSEEG